MEKHKSRSKTTTRAMGNKPSHSLTMDDIPEDPGVVLLLTAASLRSSCTEEERQELCGMTTRLRTFKRRRLMEEKLAHPASNIKQIKNYLVAPKKMRVDDFPEYHLHDQLKELSLLYKHVGGRGARVRAVVLAASARDFRSRYPRRFGRHIS